MNNFKTLISFKNKDQSMDLYGRDDSDLVIDVDGEIYANTFNIKNQKIAIEVIEAIANHFDIDLKIFE